jgi:hypothetical protein
MSHETSEINSKEASSSVSKSKTKSNSKDYVAIITGVVAAFVSYEAGVVFTVNSMVGVLNNPASNVGIFFLSIFAGVVGGDFFGRSLKKNNRPAYFLCSYFISFLAILLILQREKWSIFAISIVIVAIIAALEWSDTIDLNKPAVGKTMELSNKSLISVLGGSVNFITIQPALSIYIGDVSYVTWFFFLAIVIAIFTGLNRIRELFVKREKSNMKYR